ncbi:MAG: hypothetical protein ACE5GC_07970 [Acidimicrobiia bacterium]
MGIAGSLRVISAGVAWRTFGATAAGEALLDAMAGAAEQERMLAGMSLVKAGDRTIDLIEKAVTAGRVSPPAVRLLADIGGPRCRALLADIATESGEMGEAAAQALDLLDRIDALSEEE